MYVLIAIVKRRLKLGASLYTLLQTLSIILFEKVPVNEALSCTTYISGPERSRNQLNLL